MKTKKIVFIVWKQYQRRVEVFAPYLGADVFYFYYPWESKSKFHKAYSYLLKSLHTLTALFQNRPALTIVQFPPPPALYCVAIYSWLTNSKYVSDCHIGVTNANWLNWIFVKRLLATGSVIVHNAHLVEQMAAIIKSKPLVVRDGIAKKQTPNSQTHSLLNNLGLSPQKYVIIPCSFSADEPLREIIEAAKLLLGIKFVMTWYPEKLSKDLRDSLPENLILTGYLPVDDFNCLYANSGIALVLTKHEAVQLSGMQEAMAFEIPAVVTDLETTRFLYKDYPIYVKNDPQTISNGISQAFENRLVLEERMKRLRQESEKEFLEQLAELKLSLSL